MPKSRAESTNRPADVVMITSFGRLGYMRVQATLMQDDVFRRTQIQMSRTLYGEGDGIKQAQVHGAMSNAQVAGKDDFAGLKLVGCRRSR